VDARFTKTSGQEAFTGNELIIKGALEGGVNLITGYPGSPVADVFDVAARISPYLEERGIVAQIANNEALAAARLNGSQMSDLRAMAVMKSVGFNVAADGLFTGTLAKNGGKGGAVIVVGDDPWNDSTQVPQDSRRLSDHLMIPVLEPATFQEVKDYIKIAFELSAKCNLYVSVILSTNLADGGGVVQVGPNPVTSQGSLKPERIDPSRIQVNHSILLPPFTSALEKEAYDIKFPAALQAARDLGLNRIEAGEPGAKLGFVVAGLPYAYLVDMLREVGMSGKFPILKLGMPYPLEPGIVLEFSKGLEEIVVVENKRSFIERKVRDCLGMAHQKNQALQAPAVWGKEFPEGLSGIPAENGMNSSLLLKRLVPLFEKRGIATPKMRQELERVIKVEKYQVSIPKRTATFCSGCPHRDSTSVFLELMADLKNPDYMRRTHKQGPVDLLFHGDAGCYSMLFLPPNNALMHNYSGMGLGGGTAAGIDPFVSNKSITFIGDGTFFHSGMAAVSDSIKNNHDLLYVILDNKTTAMTGHQPHPGVSEDIMGHETFAQDIEKTLEGITRNQGIPVVRINPERREDYRAALEDLILLDGPKFIIADKECGITYHRRKRRERQKVESSLGYVPVEERMGVAEDVCEYCLECTVKTGCPGLNVAETLHGPKITTDESNCVNDGACARVKACPSFEKVTLHRKVAPLRPALPDSGRLMAPKPLAFDDLWRAYVAGIGGMGIGASTAVLVRAAQKMGYFVQFCDKKGIAIRNGGVYSHVTFAKKEQVLSPVIPYGKADLLIGIDLLESVRGLDPDYNLRVASADHTACVVNTAKNPTILSLMGVDDFKVSYLEETLMRFTRKEEYWGMDVSRISQKWLGNVIYDNTLMLGVAFQRGLLPLSLESLMAAFQESFSGVARENNLKAFTLGRDLVVHPENYGADAPQSLASFLDEKEGLLRASHGRSLASRYRRRMDEAFVKISLGEKERMQLALCFYELIHYENFAFADSYLNRILGFAARDSKSQGYAATRIAIESLYRVLAIKDEVWVSHLLTSPEKYARDAKRYGMDPSRGDRIEYEHYNRPHFDVLGMKFEFDLNSRDWMLKIMRHGKFLRKLLWNWHAQEKDFRDWFVHLMDQFQPLGAADYERWLKVLALPQDVRGFRDVRYPKMEAAKAKASELLETLRGSSDEVFYGAKAGLKKNS
jgi:indolepyruvate ferredoxin oxidoreductase